MKKVIVLSIISVVVIAFSACYKNYYDISESALETINSVSFRNDVVPIMVAGGCGCHNNGKNDVVMFSHKDTIFYSAIQARAALLDSMAKGYPHKGEGNVFFTPSQANIVKKWVEQGAKDDYVPPPITGEVTYSEHIVPLYKTDCKGGACHGGTAIPLDYTSMKASESVLREMMNSLGAKGHPGGPLSLSSSTASTFLAWMDQGFKP
jgi:hypothetical protein